MQAKLLACFLAFAAVPAFAQSAEPSRYQVIPVSEGFVRLDTVSGAMTFCHDQGDDFRCAPVSAEATSSALEPEAGATPKDSSRLQPSAREDKSAEDLDRALSLMEKAMRGFMAMSKENPRNCAL